MPSTAAKPLTYSQSRLMVLLKKDRRTMAGILMKVAPAGQEDGRPVYFMADVVNAMLADAANAIPTATDNLKAERARETRERRMKLERENAAAAGQFVSLGDAERFLEARFSKIRGRLRAIPGTVAPSLESVSSDEAEALVAEEIHSALEELSRRRA